jgi:exonuclease V subunit alpha
MLWCINLPDVTPITSLKITPINKTAKTAVNALSFDNIEDTPFHPSSILPSVKCKYWSVVKNMNGTLYSVKNVICKPWRDIYEVNTPTGIVRIDAIYNGAGLFTKYETDANDTELLFFFQNDENIKYKIDYHPSLESLKMLHSRMISLCDECGIILTNVVEEHYQLVYYMKASGNYAAITFFFNGKGFINYAAPLSDIGEADIKLSQLIEKLT